MKIKFLTCLLILGLIGFIGITTINSAEVSPTPTELKSSVAIPSDSDKDGYSNLCESLHKSDPQDKESTPKENITINVPSDIKTIQGAINIAIDGDTIVVAQGKYQGNINFNGKTITLTSTDSLNPDVVARTIIEGTHPGSVITIDTNSTLKGFTITSTSSNCRGIYCKNASPIIENCTIIDNQTTELGGGIYSTKKSKPKIINCIISRNKDSSGTHESAQALNQNKFGSGQVFGGTPQITQSWINGQGLVDNTTEEIAVQIPSSTAETPSTQPTSTPTPNEPLPEIPETTDKVFQIIPLSGSPVWYVDDDAPDTGTGTSWEDAFKYLKDALNDTGILPGEEIWVAQGTYKPDQGDSIILGDRTATFQLINGVTLKGGYAGLANPSNPDERDRANYQTILSGDIGIPDNEADNSYHVVESSGTDTIAVFDSFTVTAGNANGSAPYNSGGGMYNAGDSPVVTNCRFTENSAILGGAVFSGATTEQDIVYIDSCQTLDQPYTTYYLTQDLIGEEVTTIHITAEGIIFDGQGHSITNPNLEAPVIHSSANNVTIRNFDLTASSQYFSSANNGYGKGIHITADNNTVENNTVTDTFWGIAVSGDNNIIQNNTVEANAKGIHLSGDNNIVKNNLARNNNKHQSWGLGVWVGQSNQFINNKVYGNKYGLVLYDADYTLLKCNNIYENTRQNIYYYSNTQNVTTDDNCDDIDCIIVDSCQALDQPNTTYRLAVDLLGEEVCAKCINIIAEGVTFDGGSHTIRTSLQEPVIYSTKANTTIKDCILQGPSSGSYGTSQGIKFKGEASGIIQNNKISGFGTGLDIQSGNGNIIDNNILENNIKALHLMGNNCANNIIKNNLVKNNTRSQGWGMAVWTGEGHQFNNNKVYGNKYGIVLYGTNHTLLKCDQYFSNNYKDIYLYRDNQYGTPASNNRDVNAYGVSYSTKYIGFGAEFNEYPDDCDELECIWQNDVCEVTTITNEQSSPIFTNCIFDGNSASYGGGVFSSFSSIELINCIFSGNFAGYGGAVAIDGCNEPELSKITNCTFYGNSATAYGNGIYNVDSNPTIINCILWDSGEEIYNDGTSNPTVTYCDIQGGYTGESNIDSDPLFVNASNPAGVDGIFATIDDGLRIRTNSPCVDSANGETAPLTDITGLERIDIANVPNTGAGAPNYADIGACESGHDFDSDGMPDEWESFYGLNPYNPDANDDPDIDNLTNLQEYLTGTNPNDSDTDDDDLNDGDEVNLYNTDPLNPDSDDDLMPDGWEVQYNLDPLDPSDANDDLDEDEVTNLWEYTYNTNPNNPDTDEDGLSDGYEIYAYGTDPNNPDSDGDGVSDGDEVNQGSDPTDPLDEGQPPTPEDLLSLLETAYYAGDLEGIAINADKLMKQGSAATLQLLAVLQDEEKDLGFRGIIAEIIEEIKDPNSADALIAILEDVNQDTYIRAEAAYILGTTESDTALAPLLNALNNPDIDIKSSAALGLGLLGREEAITPLIILLENTEEEAIVRVRCGEALSNLNTLLALDTFINTLQNDEDETMRGRSALWLGSLEHSDAVPSLIEAVNEDSSLYVADNAAIALGMIGDISAVDTLISALDRGGLLRINSAEALAQIGDLSAAQSIADAIGNEQDTWGKQKLIEAYEQLTGVEYQP
ncbi:right-handed parallel beta-helix repeat-containing protein [bacterium]|nr:right-handed parallel beta-helix repeat-containing protein [bacterium]